MSAADSTATVVPEDGAPCEQVNAELEQVAAPPPDPAALADRVARYRLDAVAETYLSLFAEVIAGG